MSKRTEIATIIKIETNVDKDSKDFNDLERDGFGNFIEKTDHDARWNFLIKMEFFD